MKKLERLSILSLTSLMLFSLMSCNNNNSSSIDSGNTDQDKDDVKFDKTTIYDAYEEDRPDYGFDYESNYVRPEPPTAETRYDPDFDPAYKNGTVTTKTRMEAENAEINYVGNSTSAWKNEYSDVNNMAFDFRLSGKLATRNLNTPGSNATFRFNSDKSYTVKMNLRVSVWDDTHVPFVISDYFDVRSEGTKDDVRVYSYANTKDMSISWDETEEMVSGGEVNSKYFHFATIELDVAIYKGSTALIVEYLGKGGANIDYLELDTSASITGFDSTHYTDGDVANPTDGSQWYISEYPTDDTDGTFTVRKYIDNAYRSFSYGLPKYKTDGQLTSGYSSKVISEGKTEYSFTFKNGVYTFVDDPNRTSTITLSDYPNVTFKNGTNTLQKKPGETINLDDFATIEDGRTIQSINIIDNKGIIMTSGAPGEIKVPMEDSYIEVITSPAKGYTWLSIGSGASRTYNTDGLSNSSFTGKTSFEKNINVRGEKYTETGLGITTTGTIAKDSGLRFDTKYTVTKGTYEFLYNFENKGNDIVSLRGYQISASAEYKSDLTMEKSERYVMHIELQPGQSTTIKAQYNVGANGNFLTYFVANNEMKGMNLGMSMSVRSLGSAALAHPYAPECVKGECTHGSEEKYILTLGDGYKFADGSTSKEVLEASTLPEINNETGKEIAGWYTKDEKYIYDINSFTMPKENITIYPFFNPIYGTSLVPCSGSKKTPYLPDYFGNLSATDEEKKSEEYLAKFVDENLGYKDAIIDNIKGAELSTKVGLKDQDYFRMLTSVGTNGIVANKNYRFNFKFENRGNEAITFETIQVQGGIKVTSEEGAITTGNITLQPNEIKDVSIEINLTNKNSNIMTVVAMHSEVNNLKLGVAIAKEDDITIKNKYTLKIANNNVTFKDGTSSIELAQGEEMPEIINNVEDRTIIGWTNGTKTFNVGEFKMIANNITLKPIFSVKNEFKSLVPCSEQNSGKPSNLSGLIIKNFNKVTTSSTLVDGGENGCLEKGYLVNYNGVMAKDNAFRLNSTVGSTAVVTKGKNHQFAYNFENKGTTDIHLKLYQINTGTNITDNISVDIDLKPGESMSTILNANFATGSDNKNALSYFVITQAMDEGMNLGISMSVKLAQ